MTMLRISRTLFASVLHTHGPTAAPKKMPPVPRLPDKGTSLKGKEIIQLPPEKKAPEPKKESKPYAQQNKPHEDLFWALMN